MESSEIRAALRDADRAEAAPWVVYPPTPRWYPPATGVWAAALVLVLGGLDGMAHKLGLAGLVAVELGFLAWYRRYRGTWPTGSAPRELRPALVWFVVGALVVVAVLLLVHVVVGLWPTAVVALAGVTALMAWYERAYAAAAARARERLR